MKYLLSQETPSSPAFTSAFDFDAKIKGEFVGLVWLESQISDEDTWERVPNSLVDRVDQYPVTANDLTMKYRFNSRIQTGSATCYAGGVTQSDQDVLFNTEATEFAGDTLVTY